AALVFYILLSLGPFLLIIIEMMQLVLKSEVVITELNTIIASTIGSQAAGLLNELASNFHILEANILVIILSLVVLFFLASQAIIHVKRSIDTVYETTHPIRFNLGVFLTRNLYGFFIVFFTGLAFVFLVFSKFFLYSLQSRLAHEFPSLALPSLINTAVTIISFIFIFIFFVATYRLLSERKIALSSVCIGAFIATLFFIVGGFLISWYLSVAPLLTTYGFAGSLLFLLVWLYYSAHVLLIGAQIAYSHYKLAMHEM
ncbi:MAG: YihY/virulence factor BrkB family protein, partial [Nanoarchaeota archaeon]